MHRAARPRKICGTNGLWFFFFQAEDGIRDRRAAARRRSERGEGKAKAIIVTAIILFVIYAAIKIVPAYVKEYELQDKMQEQARFAVVNRYPEEKVREIIFKEVQDLELPVKREEIKIVANAGV